MPARKHRIGDKPQRPGRDLGHFDRHGTCRKLPVLSAGQGIRLAQLGTAAALRDAGNPDDARPDQETIGGLDITVRRNAFGRQVDSFETDIPVAGIDGGALRAVFIRAPWVESVGPAVEVLATVPSDGGADTIVAVRQGPLLATSFHPELTPDTRVHRLFVEIVRQHA